MNPIEIQFELKRRGITQKALAEELGMHPVNVSRVILGKLNSARGIDFISAKIERDPREVFPAYFDHKKKQTRENRHYSRSRRHSRKAA